jgi:hypothetical protein
MSISTMLAPSFAKRASAASYPAAERVSPKNSRSPGIGTPSRTPACIGATPPIGRARE